MGHRVWGTWDADAAEIVDQVKEQLTGDFTEISEKVSAGCPKDCPPPPSRMRGIGIWKNSYPFCRRAMLVSITGGVFFILNLKV